MIGRDYCIYFPGEGIVALYAAPNPFLVSKICLNQGNQRQRLIISYLWDSDISVATLLFISAKEIRF